MVLSTNDVHAVDTEDDLADRSTAAPTTTRVASPRQASESDDDDDDDDRDARPLQQITYEDIFPTFDDLYLWDIVPAGCRAEQQRRRKQQRRAARVLRAYCRDVCKGNTYLHRKRAEFLRVCHSRALDADRDREQEERAVQATVNTASGSDTPTPSFFEWRRREGIVDLVSAELQPRKWPHLPHRNPCEWMEDVRYVVEFTRRVLELPEGSLLYEPIDVEAFVREACHFLKHHGVDARASEGTESVSTDENEKLLTEPALAGIVAVFAVATRLQSFSLVAMVATLLLRHKQPEPARMHVPTSKTVRELLMVCCRSLSTFGADVALPATYPRALVSQWKICAYQPCASDAIATDGLYLYVFGRSGLLKIGTGYGHTVRDFVYAHNKTYIRSRDAERSWLCCIDNYLYCRTLLMQENRVDRISTVDLSEVDELFFAPTESTGGKHLSGSGVYAMVSDGKSLLTVKCIDTQAKADRRKSRPATRGRRSLSKELAKSSAKSRLRADPVSDDGDNIRVGDRVIRGPHWKWGNQDGENGSPGTVERISTWGGVKGCGITVRWDKNHRVNTYRWGAEGCYDLIVVTERDGKIVSKKPTPKNSGENQADEDPTPRHQFVVHRYDVNRLVSILEMDDTAINSFLEISPSGRLGEAVVTEDTDAFLSALHIHMLAISDSPTSWMCDGGTTGCLGDNAGTRYRCEAGCDYDLCEVCMHTTMTDRRGVNVLAELLLAEGVISEANQPDHPTSSGTDKVKADNKHAINPDDVSPSSHERESALVDELLEFWCGLYSRRECVVALRRTNYNLADAAEWLEVHQSELQTRRILSAESKVTLAPKCPTILDPVVLVAGSLFATSDLLCVICPPGLYQSESVKRNSHPTDVAWFFSLSDGSMCGNNEPVFLKGAPAGSPICVDECRGRILVHSSYLGCVEEYTDPAHEIRCSKREMEATILSDSSPGDVAEFIFNHLRRLVGLRVCLPAYRAIRAGLRDIVQALERECGGMSCGSSTISSHKSSARQLRNVRGRLAELDRLKVEDRPGYIVPYSIDFNVEGLLNVLHAVCVLTESLEENQSSPYLHNLLADVMSIFAGIVREYFIVDVHFNPADNLNSALEASARTMERLALGQCFAWKSDQDPSLIRLQTAIVHASQDALVRGGQAGLFRSVDCQSMLSRLLRKIIKANSPLPPRYFQIMNSPVDKVTSEHDCTIAFVRRLLVQGETFADDGLSGYVFFDDGLNDIVQLLFQLATQEFVSQCEQKLEPLKWSIVGKTLLSVFNACSMSLQSDQVTVKPNTTIPSSSSHSRQRFNFFVQECFKACETMIIEHGNGESRSQYLESSICGTILRLSIAEVTNYPHYLDEASRLHLMSLATAVGKLHSSKGSCRSEFMQSLHVIESSHPYSRNQSSLRKVVHIEGAQCLHIEFDERCSTIGESDFVFVTPGHAWFNSERSPFGENGIGDNGGCFFGSPAKGNLPRNGISISGDTATIMLCSTSQARESSADECQRWGLKCSIRGISLEIERWIDDLKLALATACRSVAQMDSDSKSPPRDLLLTDDFAALQHIVWPEWLEFSVSDSSFSEPHDLRKVIESSLPHKPSTRMLGKMWADVWRKASSGVRDHSSTML
ncbi:hypothetical protein PINS_up003871 [Pythium insidiosum]|nr:hypothetical protein PINS_up003871 [Pythium insidiosum]